MDARTPLLESDANDWTRVRIMDEAVNGRMIWTAPRLEALAGKIGFDPAGLAETVARTTTPSSSGASRNSSGWRDR
jgi:hypothetical protein